jgi:hypothetical protein
MAGLSAGALDREVTLLVATKTQNAETGEEVLTWSTEDVIWAQWLPVGTRETFHAQQRLGGYVDGIFRIYDRTPRPMPDTHRIVFDGKTFDLKPYIEIGRGEGLDIPATAHGEGDA